MMVSFPYKLKDLFQSGASQKRSPAMESHSGSRDFCKDVSFHFVCLPLSSAKLLIEYNTDEERVQIREEAARIRNHTGPIRFRGVKMNSWLLLTVDKFMEAANSIQSWMSPSLCYWNKYHVSAEINCFFSLNNVSKQDWALVSGRISQGAHCFDFFTRCFNVTLFAVQCKQRVK